LPDLCNKKGSLKFPSPEGRGSKVRDLIQRAWRAIEDFGSVRALFLLPQMQNTRIMPSSESAHETARKLRRQQTTAEQILWRHLRARRICNVKFRRQFPIGAYFADFCSIERRLVVEIDGEQHADSSHDDDVRSSFLGSCGYRVLRFWNHEVLANTENVLDRIEEFLISDSRKS
jgi:very-short-patch-repair endonuclease